MNHSHNPGGASPSASTAGATHHYGPDTSQYGTLYLPQGTGPHPVAVVIHGGFWRARYDLSLGVPLAQDLAAHGYAAWNLEYRRLGDGGGWPTTFDDIAAGVDALADLDAGSVALDLARVVSIGHSAGGQLAVWAASRPGQPAGAPGAVPRVALRAAVSLAGVLDLCAAAEERLGAGATQALLGGDPTMLDDRYRLACPLDRLPVGVPVLAVHGRSDGDVPLRQSQSYVAAATAAGDRAELVTVDGDHFVVIDPASPAWAAVLDRLPALLSG